jgi:hypothetical protein
VPRTRNVILLVLFAVAAATVIPWWRERRERQRTESQATARQKFDVSRGWPTLDNVPLSRAIEVLQKQAGLPISADWQRLRQQGADPDVQVSVPSGRRRLTHTLDDVLDLAAKKAGSPGSPATRLDYSVGPDGEVTIRPEQEVAAETSVFELYDVRRLLDPQRIRVRPGSSLESQLEDWVMDGVSPTSWRDKWRHAACRCRDGRLLVLQTPERHLEVGRYLHAVKAEIQPDAETTRLLRRLRGEEGR